MDRFHKAARDGNLDILKEATERQCNARDEDGMTPTLWAAFEGNLDALRLLVGRGGKVDKADNFGNTALHFAAARGHMHCVTFLANFGANLWAMDIDFHTPKELAAMNNRDEILRFLDGIAAKEEATNWKEAQKKQQKAQKNAEKLSKEYEKMQEETKRMAEQEQKRLQKEREKMEKMGNAPVNVMPHRPSTVLTVLKNMGKNPTKGTIVARSSTTGNVNPSFSDIVGPTAPPTGKYNKNKGTSGVKKKVEVKKKLQGTVNSQTNGDDFKVGEVEADGKRSVRSLNGLRRDSQVIFTGSFDTQGGKERGKITDVFDTQGELKHAISEPEFMHNSDSGFGDEILLQEPASIFDRPGFGSVAFRTSISATLNALPHMDPEDKDSAVASERSDARVGGVGSGTEDCSIGSAGSLAHRNNNLPWDDDDVGSDDEPEGLGTEWATLQTFLASAGLLEYLGVFVKEEIDLDALMLMKENDFQVLGLKMGPMKKLMSAIERRKTAMDDPGEFADSKL
ncbi:G patch domain and ankyrin repeat-containing protein 1 homolog [Gryllus bimaculatus]|nr:G patch domain and ankyrin repeat-containing protein 1 homolog [Gryllus bimaculatus]